MKELLKQIKKSAEMTITLSHFPYLTEKEKENWMYQKGVYDTLNFLEKNNIIKL